MMFARSMAPLSLLFVLSVVSVQNSFSESDRLSDPAARIPKPTKVQYEWHEQERLMFVCLDPCSWQGREYDDRSTPLSEINPTKLDTDQWCRAAQSWGAKQILFVAKHTGGFCWWQTETSSYGIKETPWKDGKGDVLAELAASCKKLGLNLGIYVYPGDDTWGAPMGSGGRTKDPSKQEAYNQVYRRQLMEVLTRYEEMREVWFDGSCVIDVQDILERYAKNAVIFQGPQATIRWAGTESGFLPYPAWNSLKRADLATGVATVHQSDSEGDAWAPLEVDTTLYDHFWFWSPEKENHRKSLDHLMDIYYQSVGHGAVLLLNSSPNTDGLIPDKDMELYDAFGEEIQRRFQTPVAEIKGRGTKYEINFETLRSIDHSVLMEDYREGERIRAYSVEGLTEEGWKELASGTAVGRMKIDRFPAQTVTELRLTIARAVTEPIIRRWAVYSVDDYDKSVTNSTGGSQVSDWAECNNLKISQISDGFSVIEIDLSRKIPHPGQYEIQLKRDRTDELLKVERAELFYEGEPATPGLLTSDTGLTTWFVNRTAQITNESSTVLKLIVREKNSGVNTFHVWIRARSTKDGG